MCSISTTRNLRGPGPIDGVESGGVSGLLLNSIAANRKYADGNGK